MGTPTVPAMIARQLVQKMAGGPPSGPSPLGPGAAAITNTNPAGMAGEQVSRQLAELQGADPQIILKILQQIKSQIVAIYARTAFSMPSVSRNVAQMQKFTDKAIEESEKAAATAQTVNPIANNASIPNPQGGNNDQATQSMGLQQFAGTPGAQ